MTMDPRLLGFLNRALGHEMAAVQQYMAQSKLCDLWGMADLAGRFRQDAIEELGHVEDLMEALLRLGVTPLVAQLPAVRLARTMEDIVRIDTDLEVEAVRLYEAATEYCLRLRDTGHRALFSRILADELHHLDELQRLELPATPSKVRNHG